MGSRSRFAVRREPPKIDPAAIAAQQAAAGRDRAQEARVAQQAIEHNRKAAEFFDPEDPLSAWITNLVDARVAQFETRVAQLERERIRTDHGR